MPVAWGKHDNKQVFLNVTILEEADALLVQQGKAPAKTLMFKALVDTGAMKTCITADTAKKLGLSPIGKVAVQGVSGTQYHNNHLFYIGFTVALGPVPAQNPGDPQQIRQELYMLPSPIEGAEFDAGGTFDVLLGMDVISTGSLKVEGHGIFSWAW